jgi:hypothetical protein
MLLEVCRQMLKPDSVADATAWNCVRLAAPELPFSETLIGTTADHGRAMPLPFGV